MRVEQIHGRTDGRDELTESLPTSQGYLTFRNARAHIRRLISAGVPA